MNNFCPECGSERIENSKYCINCGYKFPVEIINIQMKIILSQIMM